MVRWRRLERSQNVEDRRGRGRGAAVAGGVGGLGIIGVLIALFLGGGGDGGGLGGLLGGLEAPQQAPPQELPADQPADDESEFVRAILGTTETYWGGVFSEAGQDYDAPRFVLFTDATSSGCGGADARVGPHYCPPDQTIYMDLGFLDELQRRFGAQGGDFAEAYIIAHEVGHHVQNLVGISSEVRRLQQEDPADANDLSVKLELQADCLAGAWAFSVFERGALETGDIEEGLDAAESVGDDRIQATIQGRVDPESWTHGSSAQRKDWFLRGYETGNPDDCDTF